MTKHLGRCLTVSRNKHSHRKEKRDFASQSNLLQTRVAGLEPFAFTDRPACK